MYHVFQQPLQGYHNIVSCSVFLYFSGALSRDVHIIRGLFFFVIYIIVSKMRQYLTAEFESLVTKSGRVF